MSKQAELASKKKAAKAKKATKKTTPKIEEPKGLSALAKEPEQEVVEDQDQKEGMAAQLKKHRANYEVTASYTNRLSMDNGDDVAKMLRSASPETVMAAAEVLCGLEIGSLATKYSHLNKGQKRMNSGNRIRAMFRKEEITTDEIKAALAA